MKGSLASVKAVHKLTSDWTKHVASSHARSRQQITHNSDNNGADTMALPKCRQCSQAKIVGALTNISNLTSSKVSGAKQGAGGKSVDPVLVPKKV